MDRSNDPNNLDRNIEPNKLDRYNDPNKLDRYNDPNNLNNNIYSDKLDRYNDPNKLDRSNDPNKLDSNIYSDKLNKYNDPNNLGNNIYSDKLDRYNDPNKLDRYNDPNKLDRYSDPNKLDRYNDPNKDIYSDKLDKNIKPVKCGQCNKLFSPQNGNSNPCDICNSNICNECAPSHFHKTRNPKVFVRTKENVNKLEDPNENKLPQCIECGKSMPINDNENVNHCNKCQGNLCNNCGNTHNNYYPEHNIIPIKSFVINDEKEFPKNNCTLCNKNISKNPVIYNCDECQANLCDNCGNDHCINRPKHTLSLLKYLPNKKIIECNVCGKNIENPNNNNKCEKCNINLCDGCNNTHFKNNPAHKFELIKEKLLSPAVITKKTAHLNNCILCHKNLNLKNIPNIYYCKNCKGNLCPECNGNHNNNNDYKDHEPEEAGIVIYDPIKNTNEKIPRLKCIKCQKNLQDNIDEPIKNCRKCEGNLCDACSNIHAINYPSHRIEPKEYLINNTTFIIPKINCSYCNKNIPVIHNNSINHCNNCACNYCDPCKKEHDRIYRDHKSLPINTYIILKNKNNTFDIPKINCISCEKYLTNEINNPISYCNQCNGNLCYDCNKTHNINNPNHELEKIKYLFIENINYKKEKPEINCGVCGVNIKNNGIDTLNHCNDCAASLCDVCANSHRNDAPEHSTIIKKYVLSQPIQENENLENINKNNNNKVPSDHCVLCNKNVPINDNEFVNHCNVCQGNLCDNCGSGHNNYYSDHDIVPIKSYIINDEKEFPKNNCFLCNKNILKDPIIYNCENCQANLCDNCGNDHCINKPKHTLSLLKYLSNGKNLECDICGKDIENPNNENKCEKCLINLCNDCKPAHYKNNPTHINNYNNNMNDINDYNTDNKCENCQKILQYSNTSPIFNCNECSKKLCVDCIVDHNNQYPNHTIVLYKNNPNSLYINDNINRSTKNIAYNNNIINDNIKYKATPRKISTDYSCLICKIPHNKFPSRIYYNCNDCKGYICSYCKKIHDFKNYSHILTNPHKFGDEEQKTKIKHKRVASAGVDNYDKDYLYKDPKLKKMNKVGNLNVIKPKTKKNNNDESDTFSVFGSGKAFCFKCRKVDTKFQFCGKCMRLFCRECFSTHNC